MTYELTNEGFKAKVGSFEIELIDSGAFEDVVLVKRYGKELFTITFYSVLPNYKIYPVMMINDEQIDLETIIKGNYPDDDEILAQEMYFTEIYAYVLERIIEEMEFEEQEKL